MSSSTSNSNGTMSKTKKYLVGFFVFILFLFLFDRFFFYLISKVEADFYPKQEFEKHFQRFMADKNYSTLIFGTSRTYEGIHPFYFEKRLNQNAFKEAFRDKGPKYNYYFYKLYKKYAGIPRVVVYGVDYFIFNIVSDHKWLSRFKIAEEEKKKQEREINYFSSPMMLITHKTNIDTFFNNVLIHFREKLEQQKTGESFKDFMDLQNYLGMPKKDNKLVTERYSNYHRQVYPRAPGKEGDYFLKLLEELHRDGVTVILVTLPDYFGSYKTNFQRNEFIQHLKQLRRQYKNVHIINYNRPGKFPLENTDYFNDGGYGQTNSHLSKKGAKALNELLTEEIKGYYGD